MNNYLNEALNAVKEKTYEPHWCKPSIECSDVKTILEIFDAKWRGFVESEVDRKLQSKLNN